MSKPRTKAQLEAAVARLEHQRREDARLIESMRIELFDLRWQLGLNGDPNNDEDRPFEPDGNVGAPGHVLDYLARLKAEQAQKGRRRHA